jgi:hypothetical protein
MRDDREGCDLAVPGFPSPFGIPALASWTVLRPPGSWASLAVGLPGQSPDPDGVFTFRTVEIRPGWVLSEPRGGGVLRDWLLVTSRRLPFRNGQPCPQRRNPSPGVSMSRHHREFACTHPSGLPLACGPRMERALLGVFPDASHPAVTSNARQSGDGSVNTYPELRCRHHTQPSNQRARSNRATSCRTEKVKPVRGVDNLRLVLVEGQTPRSQPPGKPCPDLLGLLPAVAAGDQIVGIPDHDRRPRLWSPGS